MSDEELAQALRETFDRLHELVSDAYRRDMTTQAIATGVREYDEEVCSHTPFLDHFDIHGWGEMEGYKLKITRRSEF